jgi:cell division protease FtsH
MIRDVSVGAGLAVVVYLLVRGVNVLPVLVLGGLGYVLLRTMGGMPGMRARFVNVTASRAVSPSVTFDDIGGQGTAKQELMEALDFLAQAERVRRMGIRPLKGILLTGPPGTGKTLLAKAAANHTGSVFIAASGSEFIEVYAGVGAQRVRELFRRAREEGRQRGTSAIVFIDELEVLGGKRGRHVSHLEYDQTLNQLLVEMDGIAADDPVRVLVIGATNRADLLDDALLRPGRFDRVVRVDLPDREGRREILALHTRGKPLAAGVDLDRIARDTFGFSGAHLESLANEAAILAMREGLDEIPERCFLEAIDKVIMGEKLDRRPTREERFRIAVHEAGHAIVGETVAPGSVARIAIASRGQALGYVRQAPQDDLYLYTKDYLENEIARLLAGSVAEEMVLGNRSTGASNDFERALELARTMIASGMSRAGVVDVERLPEGMLHEIQSDILRAQEDRVRRLLAERRAVLEGLATALVEEETIAGDRLRAWLAEADLPAAEAGTAAQEAAAVVDAALPRA